MTEVQRRPVRTTPTRLPEYAVGERAALDALLDDELVAHVALVIDGHPVVLPTAVVRHEDGVRIHGSTGSPWMRALAEGAPASLCVTALDGLVVARSAFESSVRYRSAVVFGRFQPVEGAEKAAAMVALTDGLIPGRSAEVRDSTRRELAATLVLQMPIETWSMKASTGWPEDDPADVAGPAWAGVVPVREVYDAPLAAPDLRDGIVVPESVAGLRDRS